MASNLTGEEKFSRTLLWNLVSPEAQKERSEDVPVCWNTVIIGTDNRLSLWKKVNEKVLHVSESAQEIFHRGKCVIATEETVP